MSTSPQFEYVATPSLSCSIAPVSGSIEILSAECLTAVVGILTVICCHQADGASPERKQGATRSSRSVVPYIGCIQECASAAVEIINFLNLDFPDKLRSLF